MTKAGDCEEPTKSRDAARRHKLGGGPLAWTGRQKEPPSRYISPCTSQCRKPPFPRHAAPAPGWHWTYAPLSANPGAASMLPPPAWVAQRPVGSAVATVPVGGLGIISGKGKGAAGTHATLLGRRGPVVVWDLPEREGPVACEHAPVISSRNGDPRSPRRAYQLEPLFSLRAGDGEGEKARSGISDRLLQLADQDQGPRRKKGPSPIETSSGKGPSGPLGEGTNPLLGRVLETPLFFRCERVVRRKAGKGSLHTEARPSARDGLGSDGSRPPGW